MVKSLSKKELSVALGISKFFARPLKTIASRQKGNGLRNGGGGGGVTAAATKLKQKLFFWLCFYFEFFRFIYVAIGE